MRKFFAARRYLEIDTPLAVMCPGTETHLDYFSTVWRKPDGSSRTLYLRSSPEIHMKQALAHGMPRVFQMAPCFRNGNGEHSVWHHPEFLMLEWYETGIDLPTFVTLTEELLRETQEGLSRWLGKASPLKIPRRIPRLSVFEAFERFANLKLIDQDEALASKARAAGVHSVRAEDDFETAYFKTLIEKVEPGLAALGMAVLWDYPPSQSALARVEGGVARRFEMYVGRVELCNGYDELIEADENLRRMNESQSARRQLGNEQIPYDPDFDAALRQGISPACGNALGLERWHALLLGEKGIDRVVPFRHAAGWK